MKIKNTFNQGGYSKQTAEKYISTSQPLFSLSTELEKIIRFENKRPTNEIIGYKAWFTQENLPPFSVKFTKEIKLPEYLSLVQFENLVACEVKYDVYFKADDMKAVK